MADFVDESVKRFIERCRKEIGDLYGIAKGDEIAGYLRAEYDAYKTYFALAKKELPGLLEIEEDILRSVTMDFEHTRKKYPGIDREISDELWGMMSEDRLEEIDEKNRGERGSGEIMEFKKPQ